MFLLIGLHEDLNRVTTKSYIEQKNCTNQLDQIVADSNWEYHLTGRLMKGPEDLIKRLALCNWETVNGHIIGEFNYWEPVMLIKVLFQYMNDLNSNESLVDKISNILSEQENFEIHHKTLIFYCAFVTVRAPTMVTDLRNIDRHLNKLQKLCYNDIYILQDEYSNFFKYFPSKCVPQKYTKMIIDQEVNKTIPEYNVDGIVEDILKDAHSKLLPLYENIVKRQFRYIDVYLIATFYLKDHYNMIHMKPFDYFCNKDLLLLEFIIVELFFNEFIKVAIDSLDKNWREINKFHI